MSRIAKQLRDYNNPPKPQAESAASKTNTTQTSLAEKTMIQKDTKAERALKKLAPYNNPSKVKN
jgi:hypothetical protein